MINQRKKFGRGAGEYSGGGGRGGRQVSSGSYGVSKKSLGTRLVINKKYEQLHIHGILYDRFCRRAAGGKFVPPVKRDQEDDINEEIRSRVLYGSNKGSGNGAESSKGLPPELEGDERLKNIEPRMVELIMNEVCGLVFLPSHCPDFDLLQYTPLRLWIMDHRYCGMI